MKAVVAMRPGGPEVLEIAEIDNPALPDDGVLVRVNASSANPADAFQLTPAAHLMGWIRSRGKRVRRPIGLDFAGTVASVGSAVTRFRPGDDVFGAQQGALAEYVCVGESDGIAFKPADLDFHGAGCVPVAALTALQSVRNHGRLQPGQSVLVNGASGGVGTFCVQVAKALGGEVTAVCSTPNVDRARALGADTVIDYTRADFTESRRHFDLIVDVAGSRPWSRLVRVMAPEATLVITGVSSKMSSNWAPLGHIAATKLASLPGRRRAVFFVAKIVQADLCTLGDMLAAGRIRPVIDRCYPLEDVANAFRYLKEGHARGKIAIALRS